MSEPESPANAPPASGATSSAATAPSPPVPALSKNAAKKAKRRLQLAARKEEAKAAKKQRRQEQKEAQEEEIIEMEDAGGGEAEGDDAFLSVDTSASRGGTVKRQGHLSAAHVNETSYMYFHGYRYPYPYWFAFGCYSKRRWVGQDLISVLKAEYGNGGLGIPEIELEAHYARSIEAGSFRINSKIVSKDYRVKEGDHFQFYTHRHETPVSADPIRIHFRSQQLIVVDKPSSMPVHPCGNYRHNSLLFILAKESGMKNIFIVHRLDSVTSGLLILARTASVARMLTQQIKAKQVRKEYVARVQGKAPEWKGLVLNAPIYSHTILGMTVMSTKPFDSQQHAESAATALQDSLHLPHPSSASSLADDPADIVPDTSKDAVTVFTFLAYDAASDTSLIQCCPLTGRTHQIRLHLAHLGHPIANDVRYGGKDTSSGNVNDLAQMAIISKQQNACNNSAAFSASSASDASSSAILSAPYFASYSPLTFNAAQYWQNIEARSQQLARETPAQREARIIAESVDQTGTCFVCRQVKEKAAAAPEGNTQAASIPSSSASSSSSSSAASSDRSLLFSPFSTTRIRVEYIWLHAYRYSFDPRFSSSCEGESKEQQGAAMAEVKQPDSTSSNWCYEIPWPAWALELAPPHLREMHSTVTVHSAAGNQQSKEQDQEESSKQDDAQNAAECDDDETE